MKKKAKARKVSRKGLLGPEGRFLVNKSIGLAGRPLRGKQGYARPYMGFF